MAYGVTITGFIKKTLSNLLDEIDADLKSSFGQQINASDESFFGQEKGLAADRESSIWDLAELVYNSQYPDTAEGTSLDNVCAFNLLERYRARPSTITEQLFFGTASTVIPQGTKVSVLGNDNAIFETDEEVTLIAGTDEIQTIGFNASPVSGAFTLKYNLEETSSLAYNASNTDVQTALNALSSLSGVTVTGSIAADFIVTFAGDDGKQDQPLLTVGTNTLSPATNITISETTPGVPQGSTSMTCTENGITVANSGTLTEIVTSLSGLDRTFNTEDATLGRLVETDAELRIRRLNQLQISRNGPVESIKTAILDLNDEEYETLPQITDAIVYENTTDAVDAKGLPAHSIMAVVRQEGDVITRDQEIAEKIYSSKAAGIETSYGLATGGDAVTKTVEDSSGISHTIKFARPTEVEIALILDNFETDSSYPSDGDAQLKTYITTWGNALGVGIDIIVYPQLVAQINNVPGILDFDLKIAKKPTAPTVDSNIDISDGTSTPPEFSSWDSSDITINHI